MCFKKLYLKTVLAVKNPVMNRSTKRSPKRSFVGHHRKIYSKKQFKEHDFPDLQTVRDSYTHNFPKLLHVASLEHQLHHDWQTYPKLYSNWITVTEWSEQARYQHGITEIIAQELYNAVTEPQTRILTWLKNFM